MDDLKQIITSMLFGEVSTQELLDKAFEIKTKEFGNVISYSPKVFIPLTTLCRDKCAYCTFVKSPKEGGVYLNHEDVIAI